MYILQRFYFSTWKRVPKCYQRCSCCWGCCCYQIFKALKLFHFKPINVWLVTIFCTIAPWRILKLSP